MNILISGASGYLGSNVITYLSIKGCMISIVDKEYKIINEQSKYDVFLYFSNPNEISFNIDPHKAATSMIDHHYALISLLTNISVDAILYASTIRVYDKKRNPYSLMHVFIEDLLELHCTSVNTKLSRLRFGNVFGGSIESMIKRDTLVPHVFIKEALSSNHIDLTTNGLQCRDFIPISFVNRYIDYIIYNHPKIIDICTGVNFQVKEVANIISKLIPGAYVVTGKKRTNQSEKKYYATIKFSKKEIKNELIAAVRQWESVVSKI
jgi:nucleoside-diphosphate-sugar epimerase